MYSWEKDIKETDKRWIHCEKQMPDEGARVLASDVFEKIFILTRYHYSDGWSWVTDRGVRYHTDDEIIGWMPLPNPCPHWKQEEGEE